MKNPGLSSKNGEDKVGRPHNSSAIPYGRVRKMGRPSLWSYFGR